MIPQYGPATCERMVAEIVEEVRALPWQWQLEVARRLHERMSDDDRQWMRDRLGADAYARLVELIGATS